MSKFRKSFIPLGYMGKSKKWARRRNKAYNRLFGHIVKAEIGSYSNIRFI